MLAVSNTSPISNLAVIGRLDLLRSQFGTVWIPNAVASELAVLPHAAARAAIETAIAEQWIRVAPTPDSSLLTILLSSLHRGEAEAIALAVELKAGIVLMDEPGRPSNRDENWSLNYWPPRHPSSRETTRRDFCREDRDPRLARQSALLHRAVTGSQGFIASW